MIRHSYYSNTKKISSRISSSLSSCSSTPSSYSSIRSSSSSRSRRMSNSSFIISNDNSNTSLSSSTSVTTKFTKRHQSNSSTNNNNNNMISLSRYHRMNMIFGANTDVGKTVISAGLVNAAASAASASATTAAAVYHDHKQQHHVHYIKPIQCGGSVGDGTDSGDIDFIRRYTIHNNNNNVNNNNTTIHNLFYLRHFVSPHIATMYENNEDLNDDKIIKTLQSKLFNIQHEQSHHNKTITYIETAGGVLSPSTSSPNNNQSYHSIIQNHADDQNTNQDDWGWCTQGDLYRHLSIPIILVGDSKLGGISTTLSSFESLILRGYDIVAIVFLEQSNENNISNIQYNNIDTIKSYLKNYTYPMIRCNITGNRLFDNDQNISIISFPSIPSDHNIPLYEWYQKQDVVDKFNQLNHYLQNKWDDTICDIEQHYHDNVSINNIKKEENHNNKENNTDNNNNMLLLDKVIDQQTDLFSIAATDNNNNNYDKIIQRISLYDASSLLPIGTIRNTIGTISPLLINSMALARYGNSNTNIAINNHSISHQMVSTLTQMLVSHSSTSKRKNNKQQDHNNDIKNVIYQPSTTDLYEIATQLSFRTFCHRMKNEYNDDETMQSYDLVVCGQASSTPPTISNSDTSHDNENDMISTQQQKQYPGLYIIPPTIGYVDGILRIQFPEGWDTPNDVDLEFNNIHDIYDLLSRHIKSSKLKSLYKEMIEIQYLVYEHSMINYKIASIIIQPLVHIISSNNNDPSSFETIQFIDPLWQLALIEIGQSRNVPIIYDETYTGSYHLGPSLSIGCSVIGGKDPDMILYQLNDTVNVIMMNDEIHGLSSCTNYSTSHNDDDDDDHDDKVVLDNFVPSPVCCINMIHAIDAHISYYSHMNKSVDDNTTMQSDRIGSSLSTAKQELRRRKKGMMILFDEEQVKALSSISIVQQCFALGSILSVEIQCEDDMNDSSEHFATMICNKLQNEYNIIPRRIRNIICFFVSPMSSKQQYSILIESLHNTIESFVQKK